MVKRKRRKILSTVLSNNRRLEDMSDPSSSRGQDADVCDVHGSVDYFPFRDLPLDCQLHVFYFLTSIDKGYAAQVCRDWRDLIKMPILWDTVRFSEFPMCARLDSTNHNCSNSCYTIYKKRIHKFMSYLLHVGPILRHLEFQFDIAAAKDGYLPLIQQLINKAICQDLQFAQINWKETSERLRLNSENYDAEMHHVHRKRQRIFVNFFDMFTSHAPNVTTLVLPFDWSYRTVDSMARLKGLRYLVLQKYSVFQFLSQSHLDKLLTSLPRLDRLMLEVWTPSARGLTFYDMTSQSITYLDISQSRGFYLRSLYMPALTRFRVARHPWSGPLVLADKINVPCLYQILVDGVRNLEKLNDHYLEASWQEGSYDKLEEVLKSVCSCRKHKTGWAM